MGVFRILATGSVSIRVQALKGQLINWGFLYPLAPAQAAAIAGDRPSVSRVEWQVPANRQAAYMLIIQMPRQNGASLDEHRLTRTVFQKKVASWQEVPPAADNPKGTHPQYSMPGDQALYSEFITFK